MLPVSIVANWCVTSATAEVFESVLDEYVKGAEKEKYQQNTYAIHWLERTVFTVEDNQWSRNEGSLVFENRRGVVWRGGENDTSHLIFLALFPSSLVHLQKSIIELMQEKFQSDVSPAHFSLGKGARNFDAQALAGAELTNLNEGRLSVVNARIPSDSELHDHCLDDDMRYFEEHKDKFFLSKLYLRLGESKTEAILTRDGVLTLNDTELSIEEVMGILSEVIGNVPSSVAGSPDSSTSGPSNAASSSYGAATAASNASFSSDISAWDDIGGQSSQNDVVCGEE